MAKSLGGFNARASRFRTVAGNPAMSAWSSFPVPKELRDAVLQQFDKGMAEARDKASSDAERKAIDRFEPLLRQFAAADSVDAGLAIASTATPSSDGSAVVLMGIQVPDGKALEKAVKETLKESPPAEKDGKITVDAATAPDGTKLHRIEPPAEQQKDANMAAFGPSPVGYVAFLDRAAILAFGTNAEAAIVKALGDLGRTAPADATAAPIEMNLFVDRLAALAPEANRGEIEAFTKKVFSGKKAGKNRVRLTLGGQGDALSLRLTADTPALSFLTLFGMISSQEVVGPGGAKIEINP
jgi:hypothetical protein